MDSHRSIVSNCVHPSTSLATSGTHTWSHCGHCVRRYCTKYSTDGSCRYICARHSSQRNVVRRWKTRIKFNFFLPCFSSFHCPTWQSSHLFEFVIDWHREKRWGKWKCVAVCALPGPVSECLDRSSIFAVGIMCPFLLGHLMNICWLRNFIDSCFFVRLDLIRIFCAERTRTTRILLLWHLTRCQIRMKIVFFFVSSHAMRQPTDRHFSFCAQSEWARVVNSEKIAAIYKWIYIRNWPMVKVDFQHNWPEKRKPWLR